jgi:hypothetical protein
MADGKCREYVEETRRLIVEEVNRTFDVKIFIISLGANKTFFAMHLLNDNGDGIVELLNDE